MNELDEQLMEAAECGSVEEMRMLLAEGANVNAQDWERMTPLIHAAKGGHAAAVEELASGRWETKLEAEDADGKTALAHAAIEGREEAARALIELGANAAGAALRARDEESPKPALFLLFKVGGAAPNADAVARSCRAALKGIAGAAGNAQKEEKALQAALDALWP